MPSSGSCLRCLKPLAVESASGLCPTCQIAVDTSRPPPGPAGPAPEPGETASFRPTAAPNEPPTRMPGGTLARDTANYSLSDVPPPAPPGYDLLRKLEGGGMGVVYLARDQVTDREVAMKFLRGFAGGASLERFLVEVRSLAALDHPNIVRVLGHDFYRSDPYFTMEYHSGGTLGDVLRERGPLPPAEAAALTRRVAGAVGAAHERGIFHRDLKPSNVLLAADGTPKVSDFGLAKRTGQDDGITLESGALGTPSYMPPEQITSRAGVVGPTSDVYGLGATLYHLLTGRPPFRAETHQETMNQVLRDPPTRPRAIRPDIPMALEAIVMKCLEKKPADRYPTAEALAASLDRFLAGEEDRDTPLWTRWRRLLRWAGRNRNSLAGAGLGAVVLVGVYSLAPRNADPHPRPTVHPDRPPPLVSPPAAAVPVLPATFVPELTPARAVEDIRGGKQVVLVDAKKPRVEIAWGLGNCEIIPAKAGDTEFSLRSRGTTIVQILNDPGVDRYRLRAEIRQDQRVKIDAGKRDSRTARVGLVFGHSRVRVGADTKAHSLLTVGFNEDRRVGLTDSAYLERTLQPLVGSHHTGVNLPLEPGGDEPVWRFLEVDVTPDWVTIRHGGRSAACPAGEIRSFLSDRANRLRADQPGEGEFGFPEWNPRLPIGLWVSESWVSIRNVTIEALPTRKGD